jgi:hypothetical protein
MYGFEAGRHQVGKSLESGAVPQLGDASLAASGACENFDPLIACLF